MVYIFNEGAFLWLVVTTKNTTATHVEHSLSDIYYGHSLRGMYGEAHREETGKEVETGGHLK